jgi:hypothetical protein
MILAASRTLVSGSTDITFVTITSAAFTDSLHVPRIIILVLGRFFNLDQDLSHVIAIECSCQMAKHDLIMVTPKWKQDYARRWRIGICALKKQIAKAS